MNDTNANGWQEMKRLILFRLDEQGRELRDANDRLGRIETAVAALKVKAGLWGGVAGLGAAVGTLLYLALK